MQIYNEKVTNRQKKIIPLPSNTLRHNCCGCKQRKINQFFKEIKDKNNSKKFRNMQKDSRLAWGLSLLSFGVLFLIRQLNILPEPLSEIIFNFKNYPLLLGVIFLLAHKNKTPGIVLIAVALIFRLSDIIRLTQHISDFIWPVLLIIAGVVLLTSNFKAKK